MILKEFVENYICKNSIIRLWYENDGGYKLVIPNDKESAIMEWEIKQDSPKYGKYFNHKVIGVTDICTNGSSPEAINIVIEEIPLDELRQRLILQLLNI